MIDLKQILSNSTFEQTVYFGETPLCTADLLSIYFKDALNCLNFGTKGCTSFVIEDNAVFPNGQIVVVQGNTVACRDFLISEGVLLYKHMIFIEMVYNFYLNHDWDGNLPKQQERLRVLNAIFTDYPKIRQRLNRRERYEINEIIGSIWGCV